jgi:hypothetical protein
MFRWELVVELRHASDVHARMPQALCESHPNWIDRANDCSAGNELMPNRWLTA